MTMNNLGKQGEIIAPKVERRAYELPPPGPTPATLIEVKDLGMKQYGDDKPKHMILLTWATDATDSDGAPMKIFDRVTLTLSRKGHLASRIEAITGIMPREDQPYPVHKLVGGRAMLIVKHRTTNTGTYANVGGSFHMGARNAEVPVKVLDAKSETMAESGNPSLGAEHATQKTNGLAADAA